MQHFDLTNKPETKPYMKARTTDLAFVASPFTLETQEGVMTISPETTDDWDGGYYIAYQSDGSKPYAIAPKYVRENYRPA